jgi:hypothetical protein
MKAGQEKMEDKIEAKYQKTDASPEKIESTVRASPEGITAAINVIWSELKESIKNRVAVVLNSVDQPIQGLSEEVDEKFEETRLDLQAVTTSPDERTKSFREEIADTRKDLRRELRSR